MVPEARRPRLRQRCLFPYRCLSPGAGPVPAPERKVGNLRTCHSLPASPTGPRRAHASSTQQALPTHSHHQDLHSLPFATPGAGSQIQYATPHHFLPKHQILAPRGPGTIPPDGRAHQEADAFLSDNTCFGRRAPAHPPSVGPETPPRHLSRCAALTSDALPM